MQGKQQGCVAFSVASAYNICFMFYKNVQFLYHKSNQSSLNDSFLTVPLKPNTIYIIQLEHLAKSFRMHVPNFEDPLPW